MNVQKHVEHWLCGAEEDLQFAIRTIDKRGTRNSLFFANLALEKMLKALYCKVHEAIPPFIHNLVKLAERCNLQLTQEQLEILGAINEFNLAGRYPEFSHLLIPYDEALVHLNNTKEMCTWLRNQL
ncbi:MAG: HEPN domain-containing protein [Calditrichaeota bacterium]|nr:HEPN domain-containing protein [Calditrichota bacterium]